MSTELTFETIIYEVEGHTAVITLNRPHALNALSPFMITELRRAYDAAENDDQVWTIIVTANGRASSASAKGTASRPVIPWLKSSTRAGATSPRTCRHAA